MAFDLIPADAKQPLFYAEVNSSKAGGGSTARPSLLLGQKLASGTATANAIVQVTGKAQADGLFGVGSHLARMARAYIDNDKIGILYAIPVADGAGDGASGTMTITTTATGSGTLHLYIAGQRLQISISDGDTPADVGDAIVAALGNSEALAVTAVSQYPVYASNSGGIVTFHARNVGTLGNKLDIRVDYLGVSSSEDSEDDTGMTFGACTLTGAGTDPGLTNAIAAMGDERYSYVGHPWTDSTILTQFQTEFADSTAGRWGPYRKVYGHVFSGDVDTYANLSTTILATAMNNDPHCSIFVIEDSPTPKWEYAAMYCARAAASLRNDPARNLNTLELIGAKSPTLASGSRFTYSERETLLNLGLTTPMISADGKVLIQRAVTNYTTDTYGNDDDAYMDVTTPANLDYQLTELESLVTTKYARCKLVSDTSVVDATQPVASPNMIAGDIVAKYKEWERRALVEDADTFASLLTVERSSTNPNRIDVLYPPDLANNLHIFAMVAEFRLAYTQSETEAAA